MHPFSVYRLTDITDIAGNTQLAGDVIRTGTAPNKQVMENSKGDGEAIIAEKLRPGIDRVEGGQPVYG